jgi:hypothetical protein
MNRNRYHSSRGYWLGRASGPTGCWSKSGKEGLEKFGSRIKNTQSAGASH